MKSYVYDKKSIPDNYRAHRIDSLNIDKEEDGRKRCHKEENDNFGPAIDNIQYPVPVFLFP